MYAQFGRGALSNLYVSLFAIARVYSIWDPIIALYRNILILLPILDRGFYLNETCSMFYCEPINKDEFKNTSFTLYYITLIVRMYITTNGKSK